MQGATAIENDHARAIAEERRRTRQLRILVDVTCNLLAQGGMSYEEAERLVAQTRQRAVDLFPDKEDTFDLILAPRFARLIKEFVPPPTRRGRVLRFRKATGKRDG